MILKIYNTRIKSYLLLSLGLFLSQNTLSQIAFQEVDNLLLPSSKSVFTMGFTDLNGDYRDDILQLRNGRDIVSYFQTGSLENTVISQLNNAFPSNIWTVSTGDLNKNGYDEILLSGNYSGIKVFGYFDDNYSAIQTIPDDIFAQGSNFVDFDNDGYLDAFICHDDAENFVLKNDQSGTLAFDVATFDFTTNPISDGSGDYASEWIDFDNDGDLDLYIVKCRGIASQATDPRRINMLFVNDGNGVFTEAAEDYNLDIGWQSWVGQWGDVDNDGDLDCYLLNHDYPDQLLINEIDSFLHVSDFAGGFITEDSYQGYLRDFDNDGDLDVLVNGSKDFILWNQMDGSFLKDEFPFGQLETISAAIGDINSDGFLDVFCSYAASLVTTGDHSDRLFLGEPNGNHHVTISLNGIDSNREGIGSTIFVYGDWGVQRRDIRAGESYGIMNSTNAHFGLGQFEQIDSLVVRWPRGFVDKYFDLKVDQQYLVTEGQCVKPFLDVEISGELNFCEGDSLVLSVMTTDSIVWSNGISGNSLTIKEAGSYFATIIDAQGCKQVTKLIYAQTNPTIETPSIVNLGLPKFCNYDSIVLSVSLYDSIIWSTGETSSEIIVEDGGWYSVEVQNLECGQIGKDSIYIESVIASSPIGVNDTISEAGFVNLLAIGDSIHWYNSLEDQSILAVGNDFAADIIDSICLFASNLEFIELEPDAIGEARQSGSTFYSSNDLNAFMEFSAFSNFLLKSVDVFSDSEGEREIELKNNLGEVIRSKRVFIPKDEWITLDLNFQIEIGDDYKLGTNPLVNVEELGFAGPRLIRSFDVPLYYPYELENVMSINRSNYGVDYYYYFYNWQIIQDSILCESDRVAVKGIVDETSSVKEKLNYNIEIFPNPLNNNLNVHLNNHSQFKQYKLFNLYGQIVKSGVLNNETVIDLSALMESTYLLTLVDDFNEEIFRKKVIKIN